MTCSGPSLVRTAAFARPSGNTTQYAVADLVANSATNTLVSPLRFDFGTGGAWLRRLTLTKSDAGDLTGAAFRVWLVSDGVFVFTGGDNAALAITSGLASSDILASLDVTVDRTLAGVADAGSVSYDPGLHYLTATTFAFIEARGTYTPGDGETFTLSLRCEPY